VTQLDLEVLATLTDHERSYLAMHARYEAGRQLDPRTYTTGKLHPDGMQMLDERWHSRQERHDRWRVIADALCADLEPVPWGSQRRRDEHG
jgi:hypothetical protein